MPSPFSWSPETTQKRLIETKTRLNTGDPQLKSIFTQAFFEEAQAQTTKLDCTTGSQLCGAIVSVKDLFDVKGFVTKAGTKFMAGNAPAIKDAPVIDNLRKAGAVFIGHTNMTELAYSGLGLNPHYGTPENALVAGAIPGGSTAGGAISVARGIADIAIGTDTGGSLRIPAAFNGIVGFKPSQNSVSRKGCKALSQCLDSVGPMANTVAVVTLAYEVLSGATRKTHNQVTPEFIIPTNYGMDDLDPQVSKAFYSAVASLKQQGFNVEEKKLNALEALKTLPIWHFSAIESRSNYDNAYQNQRDLIDPRVASPMRMGRADEVDAITYRNTLNQREALIEMYRQEMGSKILLMPTVPIMPPSFASMESDEEYGKVNLQVLRNPTIANVMDGCSISLPFSNNGDTIGVMLTAICGHDYSLLDLAQKIEEVFDYPQLIVKKN